MSGVPAPIPEPSPGAESGAGRLEKCVSNGRRKCKRTEKVGKKLKGGRFNESADLGFSANLFRLFTKPPVGRRKLAANEK